MKKIFFGVLCFLFSVNYIYADNDYNYDICSNILDSSNNKNINLKLNGKRFKLTDLLEKNRYNISYDKAIKYSNLTLKKYKNNKISLETRDFILLLMSNLQRTKDYCEEYGELTNKVVHTGYNGTTGSYYKGNYIYGAAMDLAWGELKNKIIGEKIKLKLVQEDKLIYPNLEKLLEEFNNSVFTKKNLDEKSYYIKAGYGQKTVDLINKESREKFPEKSFKDLDFEICPTDIISYAYFFKNFDFIEQFTIENYFRFKNKKTNKYENVKGFFYDHNKAKQKQNLNILNYEDDNKFIIKLNLKNSSDDLFLAKGYDMNSSKQILNNLNKYKNNKLEEFGENDYFGMPNLNFDFRRDYVEFTEKYLNNKGFEDYIIAKMYENIKFKLNNKGVKVENEAVILNCDESASFDGPPPKIRNFYLNKPFWIIMKTKNSNNPYLIIGINNTELMTKTN